MSFKIPGVGLPLSPKRSASDEFDEPAKKKAKTVTPDGGSTGINKESAEGDTIPANYEKTKQTDSDRDMVGEDGKPAETGSKPLMEDGSNHSVVDAKRAEDGKLAAEVENKLTYENGKTFDKEDNKPPEDKKLKLSEEDGTLSVEDSKPPDEAKLNPSQDGDIKFEEPKPSEDEKPKPPPGYAMNINGALAEEHHGTPLRKVVDLPLTVLAGIDDVKARAFQEFQVRTVRDMANWKFYQVAKAIATLAEVEIEGGRLESSWQNVNDAVDKKFEKKSLNQMKMGKAEILQGIGKYLQGVLSDRIGVNTVMELANFEPARNAAALVALADYETGGFQSKTTPNDMMPLSTFRPVSG